MHYAEFAEDEVSNFVRLTATHLIISSSVLTTVPERRAVAGYQGLREQQVESHRAESWQTGEGVLHTE